jgi:16S rRNA (cytosine967-C5)-methyltransferase
VRRIAAELLRLAETSTHPLSELLERKGLELEAAGGERDAGLLRHLVLGTLRWRLTLDAQLAAVSRRPLEELSPELLSLLRLGAFQLSPHSRIPPHAAVDETVRLARRLGHAGIAAFANAVLRNLARRMPGLMDELLARAAGPLERLALATSHPLWLVERWTAQLGAEAARSRCELDNLEPPVDLRVNVSVLGRAAALAALRQRGIEASALDTSAGARLADASDLPAALAEAGGRAFYVQSRLSQIAGEAAAALGLLALSERPSGAARPIVLDACAAPGGKTLVLAQALPEDVRLLAREISERRRERLEANLARLGLGRVELLPEPDEPDRLLGRCALVLVDAPCTALGVLRRHPEIRWRRGPADPARMAVQQLEILRRAVACLEPGGALLYSVCSFEPEETSELTRTLIQDGTLEPAAIPGADAVRGLVPCGGGHASFGTQSGEDGYFMAGFRRRSKT